MKELALADVKFRNDLEELEVTVFGGDWEDDDGNCYYGEWDYDLDDNPNICFVDKVYDHGGGEYLYMRHIFKFKDKYYSILNNENSYGRSGFEMDTLKEVSPKRVEVIIYE